MTSSYPPARTPCSVCGGYHAPEGGCPGGAGVRVGMILDGKHRLVRLLGQGGMGEVYEGEHTVIGRRVAIKFLLGEYARHPEVAVRFVNEARAAGSINHENIAAVYDVGTLPDGTQYLVMEFLDGEDVDKLVRREAPLPAARAAYIVIQVCRGLDVVHQRRILHRDLKPANLFLSKRADKTDLVKILDFGVAKIQTADGAGATRTGAAIGTAHYMSPEQARGERDIDARSDVYSVGVILYELLSGKKPHEGDSLLQILHKVMTQPPVPLEDARPGLPTALYAVVRRALAHDRRQRFETAAELGDALLPFVGRALPAIRSQPGVFAAQGDVGETRPTSGSVLGMARSDPKPSPGGVRMSMRTKAVLAGGGAVAAAALVATVVVARRHDAALTLPAQPAVEPPPLVASAPLPAPPPATAAVPTTEASEARETSAPPVPVRAPASRPRSPEPKGRPATVASAVAAPPTAAASSVPSPRPAPPAATVQESRRIKIEDDPYQ